MNPTQHDSVVQSYNLNQQLYAISTYENYIDHYTAVAIGCKSTLYILKLRPKGFNIAESAHPDKPDVTTPAIVIQLPVDVITDVSWSPNALYDGKIALSFTNGSVCIISVNIESSGPSFNKVNYKKEWESNPTDFTRSVNKVAWQKASSMVFVGSRASSLGHYKLLCGCQDGSIKLYDLRKCLSTDDFSSTATATASARPVAVASGGTAALTPGAPDAMTYTLAGAEGCRDVKFSLLQSHLFASVYENGMLAIWSCLDKGDGAHAHSAPVGSSSSAGSAVHKPRCRLGAHTKSIMSVDWHPTTENVLATGGRDSDVSGVFKVWSIRDLLSDHPSVVQLYQISCATPINKIQWRCNSRQRSVPLFGGQIVSPLSTPSSDADELGKFTHHLATSNSGSMGAGSSISLWDVTKPHVPIVVLRSQCVASSAVTGIGSGTTGDSGEGKPSAILGFEWLDTPMWTDYGPTDTRARAETNSTSQSRQQVNTRGKTFSLSAGAVGINGKPPRQMMNVYQHVIAFTKEGALLVYDLRNGYFPRQHMSAAVSTVSCLGTVALHCGVVAKGNSFNLVSNANTRDAPGFYADRPKAFGMTLDGGDVGSRDGIIEGGKEAVFGQPLEATPHSVFVADWRSNIARRYNMEVARTYINEGAPGVEEERVEELVPLAPKLRQRKYNNGFHYGASRLRRQSNGNGVRPSVGAGAAPSTANTLSVVGNSIRQTTAGTMASQLSSAQVKSVLEHEPSTSGDPFEPTVIALFAKYYRSGTLSSGSETSPARQVDLAVEICRWNYSVATSVNCVSRAKVWSSLILMLPMLAAQREVVDSLAAGSGSDGAVSDTVTAVSGVTAAGAAAAAANTGGRMPFVVPTMLHLLGELLDQGDVQHTVCCWEIFKSCGLTTGSLLELGADSSGSSTGAGGNNSAGVASSPSVSNSTPAVAAPTSTPSPAFHTAATATATGSSGSGSTSTQSLTPASGLSELRLREAYVAYVDLLQKLGMYAEANVYIKHSKDKYFLEMSKSGTTYDTSCGKCNKEIVQLNASMSMPAWCQKCSANVAKCCICHALIKGLMHWCPVCSHNAHYDCYQKWFGSGQTYCPTGCGHQCCISPY